MLVRAFVTAAALTLCPPPPPHGPAPVRPARSARPAAPSGADGLYSLRARRRFAAYLRLRLLEMREAGLERAATAIERHLGPSAILPER
jgi:hypothetical protein